MNRFAIVCGLSMTLAPSMAQGQLQVMRQTIFGMD